MNLTPVELLALSKVDIGDVRNDVAPGAHTVDFVVRVSGSLKVGDDFEQRVTQAAEPWKLLALALSKLNGVSIDALVAEAETAKEEDIASLKLKAAQAIAKIKESTRRTVKGKVVAIVAADKVEVVTLDAQNRSVAS